MMLMYTNGTEEAPKKKLMACVLRIGMSGD